MQATADLVQVPVEVYPGAHATALGAAACARLALDPALRIEDAIAAVDAADQLPPVLVGRSGRGLPRPMAGRVGTGVAVSDYDVAVIGAGIVGAAIARELAGYELDVALLEAGPDVGGGTSKANTAILHTGFDAKPGTLEAQLVRRGYELLGAYARATGIPVERTGALLVAWTDDELSGAARVARAGGTQRLPRLRAGRRGRGVPAGARARPGRARRARPCRTSRSPAPGRLTWRWRPMRSTGGWRFCASIE